MAVVIYFLYYVVAWTVGLLVMYFVIATIVAVFLGVIFQDLDMTKKTYIFFWILFTATISTLRDALTGKLKRKKRK